MDLTQAERTKLKQIVQAGGLRTLSDVVRISISSEDAADAHLLTAFLRNHRDTIVALATAHCERQDVVTLAGNMLTILLFPGLKRDAAELRARLIVALRDRLGGVPEVVLARVQLRAAEPQETLAWLAAEATTALEQPGETAAPNGAPNAAEPPFPDYDLAVTETLKLSLRAVVVRRHGIAAFIRPNRPLQAPDTPANAYYTPAATPEFDIACLQKAAGLAWEAARQNWRNGSRVFFPINLPGFRRHEYRRAFFAAARKIPHPLCAAIEPVLVRYPPGFPASTLGELDGYLKSLFPRVWVYADRTQNPATFNWPVGSMGVIVDGLDGLAPIPRMNTLNLWRTAADRRDAALSVLAPVPSAHAPHEAQEIIDTIVALLHF